MIKVQNIQKKNLVYFSVDEDDSDFRGVRGKGTVRVLNDIESNLAITEKIVKKYTGSFESDLAKEVIEEIKNGVEIVFDISPKFYSAWSFQL